MVASVILAMIRIFLPSNIGNAAARRMLTCPPP